MDGLKLTRVKEMRYLGAFVNEKLTHKSHVTKKQVSSNLALLKMRRSIITPDLDPTVKCQIYKTYVKCRSLAT